MKFLYKAFRINEWFNSKLTMQIGIFLMLAFCCGLDSVSLLKPFIIFVLYAITYFALGYIANDLSDIENDKKVGKRNAFQEAGIGKGMILFIILSVLNIGIALAVSRSWVYILIIVFGYLLGIFYSFKPLRFKERGILGLIVASLCQRNLQLAIVPFLFNVNMALFALMNALSFINGIRYILIHQYSDYDNDIKSGTATFAVNKRQLTKKIIIFCYALELCLTVGSFVYAVCYKSYWLSLIAAGLLLFECSLYFMIAKSRQSMFTSYNYVPLDFFYLLGIPATFLVLIVVSSPENWWGSLIILLFLLKPIYSILKVYIGYVKFFIKNRIFIHGCRRLWKNTDTIGDLYFVNVEPQFNGAEEKECVSKLGSYAILCPCKVSVPFGVIEPYLKGDGCSELIFKYDSALLKKSMDYFQVKNKSILRYFAIYIIPKSIFWVNRKSNAIKTIVNCMACCGGKNEVAEIDGVECGDVYPDKNFYSFSGLACSELYARRKDCFMTVFPAFLIFCAFWLVAGIFGAIYYRQLSIFSFICIAIFCFASFIDTVILIKRMGGNIIGSIIFNISLYSCNYAHARAPVFKKYGIYKEFIVAFANHQRNKLVYAVIAMAVSLFVVYCLLSTGVLT